MAEKKGLYAKELLEGVYNALKNGGKEVTLPSKVTVEIANDSDHHRTRIGYIGYESATLLKIGRRKLVVALGTVCGDYPADRYDCDIVAMRLSGKGKTDEQITAEARDALAKNYYLTHSLIIAMADGRLGLGKNKRTGRKMLRILGPTIQDFIAQELQTDPTVLTGSLRPVVISPVLYKAEFVEFLHKTLRQVLTS